MTTEGVPYREEQRKPSSVASIYILYTQLVWLVWECVCRACAFDFLGGDGEAQVFCSNGDSHYELCLLPVEIECVCLFNVACVLLLVMVVAWQVVRFCAVLLILGHAQVAAAALRGALPKVRPQRTMRRRKETYIAILTGTQKNVCLRSSLLATHPCFSLSLSGLLSSLFLVIQFFFLHPHTLYSLGHGAWLRR